MKKSSELILIKGILKKLSKLKNIDILNMGDEEKKNASQFINDFSSKYEKLSDESKGIIENYITARGSNFEDDINELNRIINNSEDLNNEDEETRNKIKEFFDNTIASYEYILKEVKENPNSKLAKQKIITSVIAIAIILEMVAFVTKNKNNKNTGKSRNNNPTSSQSQSIINPTPTPTIEPANTPTPTAKPTNTPTPKQDELVVEDNNNITNEELRELLKNSDDYVIYSYVNNKDFNKDYLWDYEEVRTLNNLEVAKAIDYVNRAYEISKANYYQDATINEIVQILEAIDTKTILREDNEALLSSIITPIDDITLNYLINGLQKNDIDKIKAIKYFAKADSELEKFLKDYANIIIDALKNKEDTDKISEINRLAYNYLDAFANTYLGQVITSEKNKYQDYEDIINDGNDWNLAYKAFIIPSIPMFITNDNIQDWVCLQTNLISNYESWAKIACVDLPSETTLTRGK